MKYSYQEARRLGLLASRQAKWRRKDPYLPSFEQRFGNAKRKEVPVGLMEVPVSMIEGTFSNARRESFAPNFMPLLDENTEFGSKWARLLTVQEEEGFTDPIIVYEFNHRFYVAEGNKRTSVMKYQKVPVIPAEVVRPALTGRRGPTTTRRGARHADADPVKRREEAVAWTMRDNLALSPPVAKKRLRQPAAPSCPTS